MTPKTQNALNGVSDTGTTRSNADKTKLAGEVQAFTQRTPNDFSTQQEWDAFCEGLSMQVRYPGEHVAYRDHVVTEGTGTRLIYREVLSHSHQLSAVQQTLRTLPEAEQQTARLTFVENELRQ